MKNYVCSIGSALAKFVDSTGYILLVGIAAFLTWFFPNSYIPAVFFALLAFIPLAGKYGRGYYILLLANIVSSSKRIGFNYIPVQIYITVGATLLSLAAYILIRRPRFYFGYLTGIWLAMAVVLLVSFFVNIYAFKPKIVYTNAFFYIITFFLIIFLSVTVNTVVTGPDLLLHFARSMAVFGLLLAAETFTFFLKNPSLLGNRGALVLGWANNPNVVSMFLSLTIPFYGLLVYRKKWWYAILYIPTALAIMFTASRCGYLCLALSIVPLVLLSFRSYGPAYPFITIGVFSLICIGLIVLFGSNPEWFKKIMEAFKNIGFGNNGRDPLYEYGIDEFLKFPLLGSSANSLFFKTDADMYGDINLLHNTFITYMVSGCIIGLLTLALHYLLAYYRVITIKNPHKWHVLLFMAMVEIIGFVDNGIVDPLFVLIILLVFGTLKPTLTGKEFRIKQDFFQNYANLQ